MHTSLTGVKPEPSDSVRYGPPRRYERGEIVALLRQGLSYGEVAARIGCWRRLVEPVGEEAHS